MAEQPQQANALAAAFPTPPPFWKDFTPENVNRIADLRAAQSKGEKRTQDVPNPLPPRIFDLPAELRNLQSPEPPAEGSYRCFGDVYFIKDELPSLEALGIQQLYTPPATPTGKHNDRALILKRLAKSLLLNFVELMGIMSINPEQYAEKIQDIRTLFINIHHLLNEYRPHQARESLILLLEEQVAKSKAEIDGVMKMKEEVNRTLEGLSELKGTDGEDNPEKNEDKGTDAGSKDVWDALEKEFT